MAEILRQYMVKVDSAQEKVYRTLRDEILSMVLKPGTIISTQEIAGLLGVSRTPVREALKYLEDTTHRVEGLWLVLGKDAVDGETAQDSLNQWWCVTKGGERVNTGADLTPIADGDRFELTLSVY